MKTQPVENTALFAATFFLSLGWIATASAAALINPWAEIDASLAGSVRVIGGYSAGCLQGAESLKLDEDRIQLMRKSRHRYFAHPDMRRFVRLLDAKVEKAQYGKLLVGDISQPRGGPSTTGHASHQIGLDADFWFWLDSAATERRLSRKEEENLGALTMLNEKQTAVDPGRFRNKHAELLRFVAAQPEVARVFVHPLIKKALCERTQRAAWLSKIRPWWGHHYHFHVRLHCPDTQPDCRPQQPLAQEHGCGADLDWWFSKEAAETTRKNREESQKSTAAQRLAKKLARVPEQCQAVLQP